MQRILFLAGAPLLPFCLLTELLSLVLTPLTRVSGRAPSVQLFNIYRFTSNDHQDRICNKIGIKTVLHPRSIFKLAKSSNFHLAMAVIGDDDGDDNNDDDFEGVFSNDDEDDHLDGQQSFMRKKQGNVDHRVGLKQSRSFPPSLIII